MSKGKRNKPQQSKQLANVDQMFLIAENERLNNALIECEREKIWAKLDLIKDLVADKNAPAYLAGKRDGAQYTEERYQQWIIPYLRLIWQIEMEIAVIDAHAANRSVNELRAALRGLDGKLLDLVNDLDNMTREMRDPSKSLLLNAGKDYGSFIDIAMGRVRGIKNLLPTRGDGGRSLYDAIAKAGNKQAAEIAERLRAEIAPVGRPMVEEIDHLCNLADPLRAEGMKWEAIVEWIDNNLPKDDYSYSLWWDDWDGCQLDNLKKNYNRRRKEGRYTRGGPGHNIMSSTS